MHHFLPQDLDKALHDISAPRLTSYRMFFSPTSNEALYGLYCWNDAISSRFMRLIGVIEVILRNHFHQTLSHYSWRQNVSAGNQDSNDWYKYVINPGTEAERQIGKKLGRASNPASPNKVISGMTYGFWPRLLDISNDNSGALIPWDQLIPKIFPGHHQRSATYWISQLHQDTLFARLELVGDLRNRVAHFEPLWKFKALKSESRERHGTSRTIAAPEPSCVTESIARLHLVYRRTTQLLYWLSKDRAAHYMLSENNQSLMWLFSEEALRHFEGLGAEETVRLSSLTKAWGLKLELRDKKSVAIRDKTATIGRFYSSTLP